MHHFSERTLVGKTGIAKLLVSTLSFQLLAEINGLAKADDSKIMMVNSYVAFACTNIYGSGVVFHKIMCDKQTQKLWLIALKPSKPTNLKHARVCYDHFPEVDYYPNYKIQLEVIGRGLFSFNSKGSREIEARPFKKFQCFTRNQLDHVNPNKYFKRN